MSKLSITSAPPNSPITSASTASSGITSAAASSRGSTRKRTGSSPKVTIALTSSFTFCVPIWAAKAAPVRPANTMAVISGPSSRSMAMPTPLTTKITAPNFCATSAVWNAMITPIRKPISRTIGTALAPASVATATTSPPADAAGMAQRMPESGRALAEEGRSCP